MTTPSERPMMNEIAALADDEVIAPPDLAAFTIEDHVPKMACQPATVASVAAALRAATADRLAVGILGGGTQQHWGGRLARLDLTLSLARLNRIVEYQPEDLTVTIEAGLPLAQLQAELARNRQYVPLDPALPPAATIGGIVATAASGSLRFGSGTLRDFVLGARFVLADGTVARTGGRVVKNVAGYDLTKLLIGSFGTLGVVVEVTLKVAPLPQAWQTFVVPVPDGTSAQRVVAAVLARGLPFRALDVLQAIPTAVEPALSPFLGTGYAVVALAGATPAMLARLDREITAAADEAGARTIERLDDAAAKPLWAVIRRPAPATAVVTRAMALPSQLGAILAALARADRQHGWTGVSRSQAGNGVVRTVWYDDGGGPVGLRALVDALRSRLIELGGWLVVEACPPALKEGLDVWGSFGDQLRPMQAIKTAFDPAGLLNPGRYPL